jgi:hypothetical protein
MKSFIFTMLSLVMFGCASLQEPVDDALLGEMTQPEKENIASIKNSIITKKNEKDISEKTVEVSEQAILVSTSRSSLLAAQKDYYIKREKFYLLSNDTAKLQDARTMIKRSDDLSVQESANAAYCRAKRDADLAAFKVKEGEMSVLVSQLDFEKAKIAREYQVRRYGEKYNKLIDTKKFGDYYNAMQDDLGSRKKDYQKAQDSLKVASEKLKASGYEEQK